MGYARDTHEYAVWVMETQSLELASSIKRVPKESRHNAVAIVKANRHPQDFLHRGAWGAMPRQERVVRMRPADTAKEDPMARKTNRHPLV